MGLSGNGTGACGAADSEGKKRRPRLDCSRGQLFSALSPKIFFFDDVSAFSIALES